MIDQTFLLSRLLHSQRSERLQDILTAIVDNDNHKLLEDFVKDMDVTESTTDSSSKQDGEDAILSYAIKKSSPGCVELLVKRSLSTDTETDSLVRITDQGVYTSATLAATLGNVKALDIILRTDPKVETIDRDQLEKLIHVSARSEKEGSVECLRLLLEEYKMDIEERNSKDETPLLVAALGELEVQTWSG